MYRPLSCKLVELTRSVVEVAWVIVAEDATNGIGKVLGSFGS